ncbi:Flagellin [Caballeronia sp. SBC1]|uniref:flagellin N-terminal helical domain-containing protein n=1 Tax=unclassified Caballeronia TaxID=2646786 RepID=UPI0013E15548|nr:MULTISPECIES: flagellin [unclassified Caballeronia]QIE22185.1 Flagellin [Caballeronia sp. SBC2]QIN60208.1 Flagellin [Caballeronia sp. SBC1]
MLGINSNINSLVAQQNLNTSQSALSQAITRLSSGKRINSAADDAAGLAISNRMQTQINGLNQGVSNANDGVSMIQTASSGLAQITSSLQTIRTLAVQASSGSLSSSDQAALQQEVAQQIAEVNRVASQTTYNGKNVLDGSAGNVSFQIGANVGQTINLNLSQSLSAASMGTGLVTKGATVGTLTGLSLTSAGAATTGTATPAITTINVLSDGNGGFTFTDQNNQALSSAASTALFGAATSTTGTGTALALNVAATGALGTMTSVPAAATAATSSSVTALNAANSANNTTTSVASGTSLGTITGLSLTSTGGFVAAGESGATITSVNVTSNGSGGFTFADQNGNALSAGALSAIGTVTAATATTAASFTLAGTIGTATTAATTQGLASVAAITSTNAANVPSDVANINVSTTSGANAAMESIDNALATVNNIQATLGAAQNRFTSLSSAQQAQSTDLAGAQSQITDADFAQETANLSKAQVLQQAGISVLAQANSLPQQVLKLLQ